MCWSQLSAFKQTILDVALFTNSSCIFLEEKIKHTNSPLYRQENSMISSHTTAVKPQYNRTFNFLLLKSVNFLIAYLELIYLFFFFNFPSELFLQSNVNNAYAEFSSGFLWGKCSDQMFWRKALTSGRRAGWWCQWYPFFSCCHWNALLIQLSYCF